MSSSPYQPAASLLNKIWDNHVSLKSLAFDAKNGDLTCSKTTYAQVCQVQRYHSTLQAVLKKVENEIEITANNQGLLYVLLYELLLGPNQSIRGGGALKRCLMKSETILRKTLAEVQENNPQMAMANDAAMHFPRYVRVNTCRATTQHVVEKIRQGLAVKDDDGSDENDRAASKPLVFYADRHIPDLLVFPPGSTERLKQLENEHLKISNALVLQDKSSCFPALCLVHGFDNSNLCGGDKKQVVDWIDACAAPGNKTSHLAALLMSGDPKLPKGTLYAFDRDPKRHQLLKQRMEQFVPDSNQKSKTNLQVITQQQDFLETKPEDFPHVRGILLDPTCSGSGVYTSLDGKRHFEKDDTDGKSNHRIESLSNFQLKALEHACTFPSVQRIVYSTCSIHVEENERVVARLFQNQNDWQVVAPTCLQHWKRRGLKCTKENADDTVSWSDEQAAGMIRVTFEDETNGFFVCCLERRNKSSKAQKKGKNGISPDVAIQKQAAQLNLELYDGQFQQQNNENIANALTTGLKNNTTGSRKKGKDMQQVPTKEMSTKPKVSRKGTNESSKPNGTSKLHKEQKTFAAAKRKHPDIDDEAATLKTSNAASPNKKKRSNNKTTSKGHSAEIPTIEKQVSAKSSPASTGAKQEKKKNRNNKVATIQEKEGSTNTTASSTTEAAAAAACKKRLKKLEWKKRQKEQKLERLKNQHK